MKELFREDTERESSLRTSPPVLQVVEGAHGGREGAVGLGVREGPEAVVVAAIFQIIARSRYGQAAEFSQHTRSANLGARGSECAGLLHEAGERAALTHSKPS